MAWFDNNEFWSIFGQAAFCEPRWNAALMETKGLLNLLQVNNNSHLLDLCCGPGRHSIELARRGYNITAVDRTESYLNFARRLAESNHYDIEFVQADMRQFCRRETFDGIFNIGLSFGYFEDEKDDLTVLRNMYLSLKSLSRLVIDVPSTHWPDELGGWYLVEHEQLHALVQQHVTREGHWLEAQWTVKSEEAENRYTFAQRLYSPPLLTDALLSCGFHQVNIYSDLNGNPVDTQSRRLVAVAQK